jgi:hypothetical protein
LPDGESLVRAEKSAISTESANIVGKTLGSDICGAVVVEDGSVIGIRGIGVTEDGSGAEISLGSEG